MKRFSVRSVVLLLAACAALEVARAQDTNPLFRDTKYKNYLPHMSWPEVERALQRTDMVIIPVGSIEQHGKHLPLGTDSLAAIETCKLIAEKTDVLVAPSVLAGLSEHHMGFPGTVTLTPATFEALVFETAQSLIRHGFRRIMIYNGHGGNTTSVRNVIERINQSTGASAVFLNDLPVPRPQSQKEPPAIDWHAGEGETSLMLYLTPPLVDMSRAEKPDLSLPQVARQAGERSSEEPGLNLVASANLFRPKDTGKQASSREMSATGVFTSGDPRNATAEAGGEEVRLLVEAAVKFIQAWRALPR